ncbi:sigma-54-dependent transcriptional regulator [Sphingobacterium spiritivorum]|uniref:Sigma-54 interaction domain protein n=1 Tax=Sphingobacterium spiritivorum ATCC 33861 TaxID=525373 RepID=D7VST0_SPHSI|nr:sigma-54 dependent transcriptional regulator [Sphingobacterium spiritivorum]EFK56831.1 Sigma-54 interaction domain protein [Sphingobacterium spiritivorum ATCC 33861]QQT35145.1 sigma-54-dependent Fis family transcriptional regulator [Sphingobacterium spiritivorum]WQD36049.1 sigma-54 dependent transcriptional regulator [Sphingobacterium spiritivorum]SUJ03581.1 Transcriptional regulatory protein ZraR [Sphingobacterium spiritivorum]
MKKVEASVLVVDDQEEVLIASRMILKRYFETVNVLSDPGQLLDKIRSYAVDVVLLDMNYRLGYENGREGIYRLKEVQEHFPQVRIILMTSYANVETAVEGIKLGAIDYMLKPWDNDKLIEIVKSAVQQIRKAKKTAVPSAPVFFQGSSAEIQRVYQMGERVAKTDATVLIQGENGTGKYVLAEYIHKHSSRRDRPFIHVDLGSLNENLFESELFGYVRGAFTDARADTAGRFEQADGGTIFLDEIGNIPLHLQSKLLQVIQSKGVTRLGESKVRQLDVRIITATNVDLESAVKEKTFREDLYYRIHTVSLYLPALRERRDDIADMLQFFMKHMTEKYDMEMLHIGDSTLRQLEQYEWRGNIRELQNRIERAVILADQPELTLEHMGFEGVLALVKSKEETTISDVERNLIIDSLQKYAGNISKAAHELGVSRAALYRKLEKYSIPNPKE